MELLKKDMENLTVKVTPEILEQIAEVLKIADKNIKTEDMQQITFYK